MNSGRGKKRGSYKVSTHTCAYQGAIRHRCVDSRFCSYSNCYPLRVYVSNEFVEVSTAVFCVSVCILVVFWPWQNTSKL